MLDIGSEDRLRDTMSDVIGEYSDPVRRILVVDDEPAIRETLRRALELQGYQVHTARDGESALVDHLFQDGRQYDAVVSDITMRPMSGRELYDRMRAEGMDIPFIAITGGASANDILYLSSLKGRSPVEFIQKPVSIADLVDKLELLMYSRCVEYDEDRYALLYSPDTTGLDAHVDRLESEGYQVSTTDSVVSLHRLMLHDPFGVVYIEGDLTISQCMTVARRIKGCYPQTELVLDSALFRKDGVLDIPSLPMISPYVRFMLDDRSDVDTFAGMLSEAYQHRLDSIRAGLEKRAQSSRRPDVWLVSGPRAAGKTAITDAVAYALPGLVSKVARHVSRSERPGEVAGRDHLFVPDSYFDMSAQDFLIVFPHHDYRVGIHKGIMLEALDNSSDVLLVVANPDYIIKVKAAVRRQFQDMIGDIKSVLLLCDARELQTRESQRDMNERTLAEVGAELAKYSSCAAMFDFVHQTTLIHPSSVRGVGLSPEKVLGIEFNTKSIVAEIMSGMQNY